MTTTSYTAPPEPSDSESSAIKEEYFAALDEAFALVKSMIPAKLLSMPMREFLILSKESSAALIPPSTPKFHPDLPETPVAYRAAMAAAAGKIEVADGDSVPATPSTAASRRITRSTLQLVHPQESAAASSRSTRASAIRSKNQTASNNLDAPALPPMLLTFEMDDGERIDVSLAPSTATKSSAVKRRKTSKHGNLKDRLDDEDDDSGMPVIGAEDFVRNLTRQGLGLADVQSTVRQALGTLTGILNCLPGMGNKK